MRKNLFITTALIVLCLIIIGLSACNWNLQEDSSGSISNEKTAIVKNGVAHYSIVYPKNASTAVHSAVDNFQRAIYDITGVKLSRIDDENAVSDGSEKYILIGDTTLPETAEVKLMLADSANPYAIVKKGKHIVIAATDDTALNDAVNRYAKDFVSDYDQMTNTLYFLGTIGIYEPAFKGFDLNEIARYCIVYSETPGGMYAVAERLQEEIKTKTGIEIPIYLDTQHNSGLYEILIGHTNRALSQDVYAESAYVMAYGVTVKDASMQIACGGTFSARKGVEEFAKSFLTIGTTWLDEGEHVALSANLAPNSVPHTAGTTARIMTLNIMPDRLGSQKYPNVLTVNDRVEILAGMLIRYTPDVIGMQETCEVWEEQIPYYLDVIKADYGINYNIVLNSYNGLNNYNPIIYRGDKYRLDFAKFDPYEYEKTLALKRGYYIRGVSQVKLTEKSNGTTFIVVNSHWDEGSGTSTNPKYPERTQYCADGELAIINAYKEKYPDVMIFATGDFNSHRPHIATIFKAFLQSVKGSVASELAKQDGTLIATGGYHCNDNTRISEDVPREDISTHANDFIDHIVGTNGSFTVLRHDTILGNYCHVMTDHMPVYTDVSFK